MMGKKIEKVVLGFKGVKDKSEAYRYVKSKGKMTVKAYGFSCKSTFQDETGSLTLTAKLVFPSMKDLDRLKMQQVVIRFEKASTTKKPAGVKG